MSDLRVTTPTANVGRINLAERRARFTRSMALSIPSAAYLSNKFKGQKIIICGGGPSIEQTLPDIRRQQRTSKRVQVLALNKTHDWLVRKGVRPDISCMADPAPHVATYQTPQKGTIYLLGSTLHDDSFARFKGHPNCYLWHPTNDDEGDKEWFEKTFPVSALCRVSGKSTVGLRCLTLAPIIFGAAEIELHGFDSCDAPRGTGGKRTLYPYNKPNMEMSFKDLTMTAKDGSEFHYEANEHMARQSYEFFDALMWIVDAQAAGRMRYFKISVAGDGAIPWMAWKIDDKACSHVTPDRMNAKYAGHRYFDYVTGKPAENPFPRPQAPKIPSLADFTNFDDFKIPLGDLGGLGAAALKTMNNAV